VRGERAIPDNPPAGGVGINLTVLTRRKIDNFVAADAALNNRMTTAADIRAAVLGHEGTFNAYFYGLTQHIATSYFIETVMRRSLEGLLD